jgi:hypothetical protein
VWDSAYRRETNAAARTARQWANDLKARARHNVLRSVPTATSPDRVDDLHEDLLRDYTTDALIRAQVDRLATVWRSARSRISGEGSVLPISDGAMKR